jgi:hypothetical protein
VSESGETNPDDHGWGNFREPSALNSRQRSISPMRCPFCHQPIDRNNAWKGTADRFYCSEFCADSEPIIPSRQQSLKERFDRQYLARLERLVALRQQQR